MLHDTFDRRAVPQGASFAMRPAADGWPLRVFEWPQIAENTRGSMIFQPGRGDCVEKYFETLCHWHAQGWSITGFDWRGQSGSGRLLDDPHIGHIDSFATWTRDLGDFWQHWSQSAVGPKVIVGHSMGGHLVLRGLMEKLIDPDAMVLSAPMLGFETKMLPLSWVAGAVALLARIMPTRLAWANNERPSRPGVKRRSYLTHDTVRYEDELWWRDKKPDLVLGPPSLQWLAAAYASTGWTAAACRLEKIQTPILIVGTDGDKLVSPSVMRRFAKRIPGADQT
jgi:lysophospholipase